MRSDAQRREFRDLWAVLQASEAAAVEREYRLREAMEWSAVLEQEEGTLRREVERLQLALLAAEEKAGRIVAETAQRLDAAVSDAEQAREENRRMQLRLDEAAQALKAEQQSAAARADSEQALRCTLEQTQESLAEVRRAEAKQTKRYQTIEEEANQLAELAAMQREEIATLRAQVRRLAEERDALRRTQNQNEADAGPREATVRALVEQRDAMMAESARLRVRLRKHAPRQSEVDALQATLTQVEQERETLRGATMKQKRELTTVEQERTALRERVGELESEQTRSEQARATLEIQVSRLTEQLARSEEDLTAWRRSAQSGVVKGIGDSLMRIGDAYVESVNGPSPKPAPSVAKESVSVPASIPPPTPPPAALPVETEEDALWRQRIREAKERGWDPRSDTIVLRILQQFRDDDRRAQQQLERGQTVTARQIPPGSDRDYLAIREAIDARVNHRRECGGRWVLKWFQLDSWSESQLLTDVMMKELDKTHGLFRSGR